MNVKHVKETKNQLLLPMNNEVFLLIFFKWSEIIIPS